MQTIMVRRVLGVVSIACLVAMSPVLAAQARRAATKIPSFSIGDTSLLNRAIANAKQEEFGTKAFAPTPDSSTIVGKPFRFHLRLTREDNPYFSYSNRKLTLSVDSKARSATIGSSRAYQTLLITDVATSHNNYVGQNAFGAETRVSKVKREGAALAVLSGPTWNANNFDEPGFSWETNLSPADARATALDTDLVIEGKYALLPGAKLVEIQVESHRPTLRSPLDIVT